ncbi:unnamed protein product [Pleuronectes platessa]|uniref:Uncharacterized protein n=1 Tax=Pleuronectes platessa TaxID=8262 RepID=A0A9N7YND0_PLEPL|nr:unnamed protein product [Pleuronectes platessa]
METLSKIIFDSFLNHGSLEDTRSTMGDCAPGFCQFRDGPDTELQQRLQEEDEPDLKKHQFRFIPPRGRDTPHPPDGGECTAGAQLNAYSNVSVSLKQGEV